MSDRIIKIAEQLVYGAKKYKRPYHGLRLTGERTNAQIRYRATDSEMVEAHLAAINILRSQGVPESVRADLGITKRQRAEMRKAAKDCAKYMQKILQCEVIVSRSPIQKHNNSLVLSIEIAYDYRTTTSICFSWDDAKKWATLDEFGKLSLVTQCCKNRFPRKFSEAVFSVDVTEAGI